MPTTAERPAGN